MKTKLNFKVLWLIVLIIVNFNMSIYCLNDNLASTPPMGFSTWNEFGCTISEETLVNTGKLMIENHPANWEGKQISLREAGYTYVNIDDCWHAKSRDEQGNPQWDSQKFPRGLKWLSDTLHQMGLKVGIYSCAGTATCCNYFAAFDPAHPDVGYDQIDAYAYASWGIDYLKHDWCNVPSEYTNEAGSKKLYVRMRDALKNASAKTGRPIVFSLCNWGQYNVHQWGDTVGHLWRTGSDITPTWSSILTNITINSGGAQYAKPGAWNDPDMMEVGNGSLTLAENRAHMDLWCISAAPLILGNDLSKMSDSIFSILTNREVIAVDQDSLGYQGRKVRTDGNVQIWTKKLKNGAWAVVLVNDGTTSANSSVKWSDIEESDTTRSFTVRDLWQHNIVSESARGSYVVNSIPAHGTVHLVFGTAYWMESVSIDNVVSGKSSLQADENKILVRKYAKTTNIYIPFASSTVNIFNIQGKKIISFYVNKPSWRTLPNYSVAGNMGVIQIVTSSGKKITWSSTNN